VIFSQNLKAPNEFVKVQNVGKETDGTAGWDSGTLQVPESQINNVQAGWNQCESWGMLYCRPC